MTIQLTDEIKVKLYSHALSQFGQIEAEARKPTPIEIISKSDGAAEVPAAAAAPAPAPANVEAVAPTIASLNRGLPGKKKKDAESLTAWLYDHPQINWNDKGELMDAGRAIPNSHIKDLFEWVIRDKRADKPTGFDTFYRKLRAFNVPISCIGNTHLKRSFASPTARSPPVNSGTARRRARRPTSTTPTAAASSSRRSSSDYDSVAESVTPLQNGRGAKRKRGRVELRRAGPRPKKQPRFEGLYK